MVCQSDFYMKRICIAGGGNLAHTCIGRFSQIPGLEINLLTGKPDRWSDGIIVHTPDGRVLNGRIFKRSSDPAKVVPGSDIVLLCLPAYCVENILLRIRPYLGDKTIVGSIVANTGFFIYCHRLLAPTTRLFGLQRVPYISRVVDYGREANLLSYSSGLYMATENIPDREAFRLFTEKLFGIDTKLVDTFYEVTLSNSNPILHTGRIYTMWKDWDGTPYDRCPLFYKEWTLQASELEIRMDKEFFRLLHAIGVNTGNIQTMLTHYDSTDAAELTRKLQSIKAFENILSPMTKVQGGWIPDFTSRYFTEDFPYGLRFIKELAAEHNVSTPNIDMVYDWGTRQITTHNM